MLIYKEINKVEKIGNWAKMYYCFLDLDRYDSAYFLNYLIDTQPMAKRICLDEGYREYREYTDTFFQERLGAVSNHIINEVLKDLVNHDYIMVHHYNNKQKGIRYIKLNYDKLDLALGIENTDLTTDSIVDLNTDLNSDLKNFKHIIISDYQNIGISEYQGEAEASIASDDACKTSSLLENLEDLVKSSTTRPEDLQIDTKSKDFKDICKFIRESNIPDNTKDILIHFYEANKGRFTIEQIKNNLNEVAKQCRFDWNKFNQCVNEAYSRGWKSIYYKDYSQKYTAKKSVKCEAPTQQRRDVNDYAKNEDGTPMEFDF